MNRERSQIKSENPAWGKNSMNDIHLLEFQWRGGGGEEDKFFSDCNVIFSSVLPEYFQTSSVLPKAH